MHEFGLEALKQFEISVRAQWTYEMAMEGGPHAFEDESLHVKIWQGQEVKWHEDALKDLDENIKRSYDMRRHTSKGVGDSGRPSIWACSEMMSFGNLSKFYSAIHPHRIRGKIAKCYGLSADNMKSFLEHAGHVRNLCAHHMNIWNRLFVVRMAIPIALPESLIPAFNRAVDARVYNTIVMLAHIMKIIEPPCNWHTRIGVLLRAQNESVLKEMGFPDQWQKMPFWAE